MTQNWQKVPLEQVITHRKEFIEIDDLQEYKRCRVQLHAKGVVLRDIITGALIKIKKQQICREGEFLVAEIDAKVGGYGIMPEDLKGAIVSSHYFLFTVDETQLDSMRCCRLSLTRRLKGSCRRKFLFRIVALDYRGFFWLEPELFRLCTQEIHVTRRNNRP